MPKENIIGKETEHLIEAHLSLSDTLNESPKGRCMALSDSQVESFFYR